MFEKRLLKLSKKIPLPHPSATTAASSAADPIATPTRLFLQFEEIEHRTPKVRRPQSNGFIERFHRTLLEEHLPQPRERCQAITMLVHFSEFCPIFHTDWPSASLEITYPVYYTIGMASLTHCPGGDNEIRPQ